jgi:hypothetical protein
VIGDGDFRETVHADAERGGEAGGDAGQVGGMVLSVEEGMVDELRRREHVGGVGL